MFITKEQVKMQCRISPDNHSEDKLIETIIGAVEQKSITRLNRNIYKESVPKHDPDGMLINDAIVQGMLFLATHFYEHRSAVSDFEMLEVPKTFDDLLGDYRIIRL